MTEGKFSPLFLSFLAILLNSAASKLGVSDPLNSFGLKLLRHSNSGENVMISPYSLSTAVAMLNAGTGGTSKSQIDEAFGWEGIADVPGQYQTLIQSVKSKAHSSFNVSSSNRMYLHNYFQPLDSYTQVLTKYFDADVKRVDFSSGDASEIVQDINSWVKHQTNGKIKRMFDDIDRSTKSILINTVYFNAEWKYPFQNTVDRPFYLGRNNRITAETMLVQAPFAYYRGKSVDVVKLPYRAGGRDISMIVIKPAELGELAALEKSLTKKKSALKKLIKNINKSFVRSMQLAMPKFEFGSKIGDLKEILIDKFGVTDVFDSASADLSGVNGRRNLYVSSLIHQTFISVDEKRTEAGAATAVQVSMRSRPFSLKIDRPFLFLIYDGDSDLILFLGRVYTPGKQASN